MGPSSPFDYSEELPRRGTKPPQSDDGSPTVRTTSSLAGRSVRGKRPPLETRRGRPVHRARREDVRRTRRIRRRSRLLVRGHPAFREPHGATRRRRDQTPGSLQERLVNPSMCLPERPHHSVWRSGGSQMQTPRIGELEDPRNSGLRCSGSTGWVWKVTSSAPDAHVSAGCVDPTDSWRGLSASRSTTRRLIRWVRSMSRSRRARSSRSGWACRGRRRRRTQRR